MGILVRIPTPLRKLTGGEGEVRVEGKTIREVIDNIESNYKGIKERICDENGNIRKFVNVYLNDEDIRFLNNLDTITKDSDSISIVPAIAGGAQIKKKVYLTYPQKLIREPLIYRVSHKYNVITNIRGASVSDDIGLVALELEGEEEEVEKAIQFLKDEGVKVEPIEKDVIE